MPDHPGRSQLYSLERCDGDSLSNIKLIKTQIQDLQAVPVGDEVLDRVNSGHHIRPNVNGRKNASTLPNNIQANDHLV
ncbi:hypothetical protein N7466_003167 [Penicillium verhagenii]|uniref:uncharacterized protein n=1 Tax=Penicillium verhagenii TaxID=1562060 RepID=UPI00254534B3|nr:uncharacterized protein N7466_003167 [Penicillium verhagenii]KAJ5936717.1 hypothetical protein N7466_003167 [Penicillium verhagenii]